MARLGEAPKTGLGSRTGHHQVAWTSEAVRRIFFFKSQEQRELLKTITKGRDMV